MFPVLIAAIGVGIQAAGFAGEAFGAAEEADAAERGARQQMALADRQNKVYQQQATLASQSARSVAAIKTSSASEANRLSREYVSQANAIRQQIVGAQNQQTDATIQAEGARFQQMSLESARRRRDIVRNAMYARATALAGATASGAQGGSGLQGGFAQIRTEEGQRLLGEYQNFAVGDTLFQANKAYAEAGSLVNQYQADLTSRGSLFERDLSILQANTGASLAVAEASFTDRNAQLSKQLYSLQTQADKSQSATNINIGSARTTQATFSGVAKLGSSLTNAGNTLFNT